MKLPRLIATLAAAALCVFIATPARAQLVTNSVKLNILFIPQGPTATVDGTNTLYPPVKTSSHNADWFLQEIGAALHARQGANLSSEAKLVILTGANQTPLFAVIDGSNFYGLTNMMQLFMPLLTTVRSGTQNGGTDLAFPKLKTSDGATGLQ